MMEDLIGQIIVISIFCLAYPLVGTTFVFFTFSDIDFISCIYNSAENEE